MIGLLMSISSNDLTKATVIDGVAATEDRDSQNEILSLDGADIKEMTSKGYFNDNHGSGFANTLGRIIEAKKIFKEADASTNREKDYWHRMKKPFLYVKGYLFDEAEHPNAKAVAAIMKEFKKMGTPLDVQMSVEGKVKQRGSNGLLKESMIRNVALTLVPANKNTGAQVVPEEVQKAIIAKYKLQGSSAKYAAGLMKSMSAVAVATLPGFIEIVDEPHPYQKIYGNIAEIRRRLSLCKMLSVGYGAAGAPASRVSGSVLAGGKKTGELKSVTFGSGKVARKKKEKVLKSLIRKVSAKYPNWTYGKIVDNSLKAFHSKTKGE